MLDDTRQAGSLHSGVEITQKMIDVATRVLWASCIADGDDGRSRSSESDKLVVATMLRAAFRARRN